MIDSDVNERESSAKTEERKSIVSEIFGDSSADESDDAASGNGYTCILK